jgi:hypothetical protein
VRRRTWFAYARWRNSPTGRDFAFRRSYAMLDVVFIAAGAACFFVCGLYAFACDKL